MKSVPVLIAGGGPGGMTLACDLARRGIACLLVERNPTTTRHPKDGHHQCPQHGAVPAAGAGRCAAGCRRARDNNFDVSWITYLTGHELHRFRYPSVDEWRRLIRENNDGSMPGEPPMRVCKWRSSRCCRAR